MAQVKDERETVVFNASPTAHLTRAERLDVLLRPGWGWGVQSRKCLPEVDLAHDLLFLAGDIIK